MPMFMFKPELPMAVLRIGRNITLRSGDMVELPAGTNISGLVEVQPAFQLAVQDTATPPEPDTAVDADGPEDSHRDAIVDASTVPLQLPDGPPVAEVAPKPKKPVPAGTSPAKRPPKPRPIKMPAPKGKRSRKKAP